MSDKNHSTEIKQAAINWLIELKNQKPNAERIKAFEDWLKQDSRHGEALAGIKKLYKIMSIADKHSDLVGNELSIYSPPPGFQTRQLMPALLGFVAIWFIATSAVLPDQFHLLSRLFSDYRTQTGEIREIQLDDGSRLLMNTNSAISVDFKTGKRTIKLHHGQVRFDVAKDNLRPFEVVTEHLNVRALGTVFEVYAPETGTASVVVQQHAVAIKETDRLDESGVEVAQGYSLEFHQNHPLSKPTKIALDQRTAWQQHRLLVKDWPLQQLINELERYRFGRIFIVDAKLKQQRISGVFSLDNPDATLEALCLALGVKQTQVGPWWTLLRHS